jgi:hypothetical protein
MGGWGEKAFSVSEQKIKVIARSDGRGEEVPRVILYEGMRIDVLDILDRWIESGQEDRVVKRCFRVRGSDGGVHRIDYHEASGEWHSP